MLDLQVHDACDGRGIRLHVMMCCRISDWRLPKWRPWRPDADQTLGASQCCKCEVT